MTVADNLFRRFEQAVSHYKFILINYIGFNGKGMLPARGCGDTNDKSQINKTEHLAVAYKFEREIYGK